MEKLFRLAFLSLKLFGVNPPLFRSSLLGINVDLLGLMLVSVSFDNALGT